MKIISAKLLEELDRDLKRFHLTMHDNKELAIQSINKIVEVLEQLRTFAVAYSFTHAEEIEFFKRIKPQFVSKLLYFQDLYHIEINRPCGGRKDIKRYLQREIGKLKMYCSYNCDFYKYMRSGSDYLDSKYFVRGQFDIRLTPDDFFFQTDNRFCTSHDFKAARLLANDLLQTYIEKEMNKLSCQPVYSVNERQVQKWTGSKVALIELIYALHAEGVLNNGATDLKETTKFFEETFAVDLGQYHRTFFEMRARKSERTKFLNSLRKTLVSKMDEVDEV